MVFSMSIWQVIKRVHVHTYKKYAGARMLNNWESIANSTAKTIPWE